MASRGGSVLQAPCRSAGQPSAAQMPPRRCREAKSQLVSRLGFELVPVVSPTGPCVCVCVLQGLGTLMCWGRTR